MYSLYFTIHLALYQIFTLNLCISIPKGIIFFINLRTFLLLIMRKEKKGEKEKNDL